MLLQVKLDGFDGESKVSRNWFTEQGHFYKGDVWMFEMKLRDTGFCVQMCLAIWAKDLNSFAGLPKNLLVSNIFY